MPAPDITEGLPSLISARTVSAEAEQRGVLYDVVVGGIGLVFAIDSQNPYLEQTVDVQKQQIDTSLEAGEQTLDGLWTRSQTSWHLGAGAAYYEPDNRSEPVPSKYRYRDSRGVNVWTPGEVSLHPLMVAADTTAATTSVCAARLPSGDDVWYARVGNEILRHTAAGTLSNGTAAAGHSFAGGRLAAAGQSILCGSDIGIYSTPLEGSAATLLHTQTDVGALCQPWWVKSRVLITRTNEVHQLPLSPGGTIASSGTAATQIWKHPDPDWKWSGVTETPDAVLAAGYSGGTSMVYSFVLVEDAGAAFPKLGQPFQVAEMPPGEEIRCIRSYLGKYLGIGTTAGVRVAAIGARGEIQYGPLIVETSSPVVDLGGRDSYLYAATGSSVIRVGLEAPVDEGLRFPYAFDVETPGGAAITALAFDGQTPRVVLGCNGVGTFEASPTAKVAAGWLESGAIRYATTAPKAFHTMDVTAATPPGATVGVSAVVESSTYPLFTIAGSADGVGVSLRSLPAPLASMSYRLDLAGDAAVENVAVRAAPAPHRQFLHQYPVQVVDDGRDARGARYGKPGHAAAVLASLRELINSKAILTVQDRTAGTQFEAVVERLEFVRTAPRGKGGEANFGGVAKVTVKTV